MKDLTLDSKSEKRKQIDAHIAKYSSKVELAERGPLNYDKDLEDPDYHYFWPLASEQSSWESIGYETCEIPGQVGDNSVSKPEQLGTATEVRYRTAHHVLMRTPIELYNKQKNAKRAKNLAMDERLKVSPDTRLTSKITKTPE